MAVDMLGFAVLLKPKPSSTRALGLTALQHVGRPAAPGWPCKWVRPGFAL
jgi:hypothetical protein